MPLRHARGSVCSEGKGLFFICGGHLRHSGILDLKTFTKIKGQDLQDYSRKQSLCQLPLTADYIRVSKSFKYPDKPSPKFIVKIYILKN